MALGVLQGTMRDKIKIEAACSKWTALTFYEVDNFNVIVISHQSSIHLKRDVIIVRLLFIMVTTQYFFQPVIQNPFPDGEVGKVKPSLLSLLLMA